MDKQEARRFGAWVSLIGGLFFVTSAVLAIYVAFFIPPEKATHFITSLAHLLRGLFS